MVGVVFGVEVVDSQLVVGPSHVAGLLQLGELAQLYVEHVLGRPYYGAFRVGVGAVVTGSRQRERYLVFVVVIVIVGTQAHEECQLSVLQVRGVDLKGVGMGKHLYALVVTHVVVGVLVYRNGGVVLHVVKVEAHSLLIVLHQLWL